MSNFVHLRTHSFYTIDDGMLGTNEIVKLAAKNGQPAVAVTDTHKMMNAVNFYKEARYSGIKPIMGSDVWIEPDVTQAGNVDIEKPTKLLLLAKNNDGYHKIIDIISRSYLENQIKGRPYIKQSWLKEMDLTNVIALSGDGEFGEIGQQLLRKDIPIEEARNNSVKAAKFYKETFGDNFYIEVQRAGFDYEFEFVKGMYQISRYIEAPLVATHPIQFEKREDFFAHEVRACIASGEFVEDANRTVHFTREQYFKTSEEMAELFQDIPEAVENAGLIAQMCSAEVKLGHNVLPEFETSDGSNLDQFLRSESEKGLEERLEFLYPDIEERNRVRKEYDERLDTEINIIVNMGFPGYFMIVADFIRWAKEKDIPVGPGRGSGAGSLVAYALKITDIDPLKYNLLFERFLNPERVSMPDFDIDFESNRREEVIEYVKNKYNQASGEYSVSQISTLGMMKAKAVIRDVGRVLQYNYTMVDSLAKLMPTGPKAQEMTLKDMLESTPKLQEKYDNDPDIKRLIDVSMKIEGLPKSIGKHAAGILISPTKVSDFSPLYLADGGTVVSQYDKNQVEYAGLVKFDFLALSNLTAIYEAVQLINQRPEFKDTGKKFDISAIDINDSAVYRNLASGNSVSVFQFESSGMQGLLKKANPDCFEDLIALVALYRPGPLQSGMVDNYIQRKHGLEEVSYPDKKWQHECLKEILEPTYGVIVYQEQVMQIAQKMAGYTLGEADLLRRAMGKKKPEEMEKQKSIFQAGAEKNGIDGELASKIFELVEKFAGYGFNKSHSAAYALISYQTAYLKTHYPSEFYAATMSDVGTDKLDIVIKDARKNNIKLLPPDVNEGAAHFLPVGDDKIRYGLSSLKGVSAAALKEMEDAKLKDGPFTSLFDFCRRINRSKLNKTTLERLIQAGAFDTLHPNRASAMASMADGLDYSSKLAKQKQEVNESILPELFGEDGIEKPKKKRKTKEKKAIVEPMMTEVDDWSPSERLEQEKTAIGFYFSGHPFDIYKERLGGFPAALPLSEIETIDISDAGNKSYLISGLVTEVQKKPTRGNPMGIITIDDGLAEKRLIMFDIDEKESYFKKGEFVALEVKITEPRQEGWDRSIMAQEVFSFDEIQFRLAVGASIAIKPEKMDSLYEVLEKHKGPLKIQIYHPDLKNNRYNTFTLPEGFGINGSPECFRDLRNAIGGENRMKIAYAKEIVFAEKPKYKNKFKP